MTLRRAVVFGLVLAVLAFVALRWWAGTRAPSPVVATAADTSGAGVRAVSLWFVAADGVSLANERRELPARETLHERVAILVEELAKGPRGAGTAALPAGTSLLHVYEDDRGLLTVDLSRGFVKGFRGGATAEGLAIGALVRTLADDVPGVRRVLVVCGGAPLATLGGHVALDRPLDVEDWP